MLKSAVFALAVFAALILRFIYVPLLGAFVGAAVGFIFNDTASDLMYALGLGGMAFWQLGVIVSSLGVMFNLSAPVQHPQKDKTK